MVGTRQTRSMATAASLPKPEPVEKKLRDEITPRERFLSQQALKRWIARYPPQSWELLRVMEGWNMIFEPSNEELIERFKGKLFAPQRLPPEDFWSEPNAPIIAKMACDNAERLCKRKAYPDIGLFINGEHIVDETQVRILGTDFIKDFRNAGKSTVDRQIRSSTLKNINNARRYPEFVTEAKIIGRNSASILMQSPGSKSDLHTDVGQGGAFCTGTKLWAFFPPTESNMELMRQYYSFDNQPSTKSEAKKKFWDTHEFEHGVWITQNPGELLYTPSGTPHAVFTLSWSVLISAQVDTAVTFVRNLKYQQTELESMDADNVDSVKSIHLALRELTAEKIGRQLFVELRHWVKMYWPRVEERVKERATREEWREVVLAMGKLFEGVGAGGRPDCEALNVPLRKRKRA